MQIGMRRFRTRREDVAGCVQGGCKALDTCLEHVEGIDSLIYYTATAGLMTLYRLPMIGGLIESEDFLDFTPL